MSFSQASQMDSAALVAALRHPVYGQSLRAQMSSLLDWMKPDYGNLVQVALLNRFRTALMYA